MTPDRRRSNYYISRWASAGAPCCKTLVAAGVGAATGAGAYGFLYERDALELTRSERPGRRDCRRHSTACASGCMTDVHRSQWVSDVDVRPR